MDKTYNDLMDIVNRTKKFDAPSKPSAKKPRVVERDEDDDIMPVEYDVDTKPKRKSSASSGLFGDNSAIGNLLEKSTKKKSTASTTTKKATTTTKKTTKPKTEEKVEKPKAEPKPKTTPKPKPVPKTTTTNIEPGDPKNAQLYEALRSSLFSGGTDISEYMTEDEELSTTQESLQELRAKREAQKINAEITKEQQEYEQLFNGSFGSYYQDEEVVEEENTESNQKIDVAQKNAQLASNLNQILNNLENKKNNPTMSVEREKRESDTTFELDSGNKDLDKKIAEYYKRKQEKIDKYNAEEEEGIYTETKKDDEEPVDYESIFGGSMVTRDELLGITPEQQVESVVEESEENVPTEAITEEAETIEESIQQIENIQPSEEETTEMVEEAISEETAETPVEESRESHIKSLLSDLLYSKKEFEEEIKEREEKEAEVSIEEKAEEVVSQEGLPSQFDAKDYAEFWGAESFEQDEEENPEVAEEEKVESVEGDNFVMTEAEPVPQEVVEYADRSIMEVESPTEEIVEEVASEEISDKTEEVVEEEPKQEEVTESPSTTVIVEDDDDDFVIRKNPVVTEESVEEVLDETTEQKSEINETETTENTKKDSLYDLSKSEGYEDYIVSSSAILDEESQNTVADEQSEETEEVTTDEEQQVEQEQEEKVEESTVLDEDDKLVNEIFAEATAQDVSEVIEEDGSELLEDTTEEVVEEKPEEENDDHFEQLVESEKIYAQQTTKPNIVFNDEDDDNTYVMSTLPENKVDVFGNKIRTEEDDEEPEEKVEEKDDTISKEEFYNEMARLQENLINELKGNNLRTEGVDFFAEKEPVNLDEKAEDVVNDIIDKFEIMDEIEDAIEDEEKDVVEDQKEVVEETPVVNEVGSKAEPVDPSEFDNYNLLNKDVALNDEDLEYQEKSEEEKEKPQDACFYMSPEDKEKKAEITDEFMTIYEKDATSYKEVGDINIFKNIGNAVPSSEILKEQPVETSKETSDSEIEAIYTLMGIEKRTIKNDNKDIKVLYVASECQPFIASGGLADVAGSLPKAIAEQGNIDVRVIMPLYGTIKADYKDKFEYLGNFTVHLSWRQEYCGLFRYFKDGVTYYFIDNERYFKRDKIYGYYDDGERFAYFSKAIVEALPHLNFFPDIIHCNDWQSSLVSAYIKTGNWSDFRYYKIKHVYTIHNVEYQGVYGMENLKDLFGIDYRFRNDVDYNGDINLTKTAIQYCDKFTTVSDSYCDNLKQPYCSRGLHHIIIRNEYKLSGIINGIDYDFYNPATDTHIFKNYDIGCMEEKVLNKKLWQDEIGLPVDGDTPMIAIVSRLVSHKGLDLITKIIHNTLQQDIQIVVVGTGDDKYVDFFKQLEAKYPTKVRAFVDTYSNEIARKAYAASDIFVMPSKIEPCGLSQMIASRYGSVPIVREVGGLKDSIRDFGCEGGGNGYTFTNYNPNDLQYQLDRAIKDYSNRSEWKEKMKICMSQDFTWKKPALKYIDLYKSLMEN